MDTINDVRFITTKRDTSKPGELIAIENLMFDIKRVYYIKGGWLDVRGGHAYKTQQQVMVCPKGKLMVVCMDSQGMVNNYRLSDEINVALYIPPNIWRVVTFIEEGSIYMGIMSGNYDPSDYLRDYDAFIKGEISDV